MRFLAIHDLLPPPAAHRRWSCRPQRIKTRLLKGRPERKESACRPRRQKSALRPAHKRIVVAVQPGGDSVRGKKAEIRGYEPSRRRGPAAVGEEELAICLEWSRATRSTRRGIFLASVRRKKGSFPSGARRRGTTRRKRSRGAGAVDRQSCEGEENFSEHHEDAGSRPQQKKLPRVMRFHSPAARSPLYTYRPRWMSPRLCVSRIFTLGSSGVVGGGPTRGMGPLTAIHRVSSSLTRRERAWRRVNGFHFRRTNPFLSGAVILPFRAGQRARLILVLARAKWAKTAAGAH